jgi:hypothetical protein
LTLSGTVDAGLARSSIAIFCEVVAAVRSCVIFELLNVASKYTSMPLDTPVGKRIIWTWLPEPALYM